jgi:hypothetical protein
VPASPSPLVEASGAKINNHPAAEDSDSDDVANNNNGQGTSMAAGDDMPCTRYSSIWPEQVRPQTWWFWWRRWCFDEDRRCISIGRASSSAKNKRSKTTKAGTVTKKKVTAKKRTRPSSANIKAKTITLSACRGVTNTKKSLLYEESDTTEREEEESSEEEEEEDSEEEAEEAEVSSEEQKESKKDSAAACLEEEQLSPEKESERKGCYCDAQEQQQRMLS